MFGHLVLCINSEIVFFFSAENTTAFKMLGKKRFEFNSVKFDLNCDTLNRDENMPNSFRIANTNEIKN